MSTDTCDCLADGYCPRYQRIMSGRFREICRGIDVDLGTAAVFRGQWLREARHANTSVVAPPTHVALVTEQMPGDAVAMTAAIHSLHRAHPGRFLTSVITPYPEVFAHNPYVAPLSPNAALLRMHYPAIIDSNDRGIHFMQGWCEFLGAALGVHIPLLTNRPHLYFDSPQPRIGDYWVVCSGGKQDFTAKQWHGYQDVVSLLRGVVRFVQVGSKSDIHPRLRGADDLVGKTTLRQLFDLVRAARGVLCGVSLLMHVAAAVERPAVVIAGGREPVQWNSYPLQHYLHAVGMLPCRSYRGRTGEACWRSRVVPLNDGSLLDRDTCERPDNNVPACMKLIRPAEVAELILRYNTHTTSAP